MAERTTEARVIAATWRFMQARGGWEGAIEPTDAISQDLLIFGIDVDDFVQELLNEFGDVVHTIPWLYYTDQTNSYRGCRALFVAPILIPWMLLKKAVMGSDSLSVPDPTSFPHRLTLREIAAAIDAGGWSKDWQSR
ncbi:hypothetical protein [Sphingomonas sp. LHG3443-2]|uniref:hypothetical protein n=1 Tax=Sphingomonas sp. LHG3443-2 TaxID=2804639 RepID=UPI003CF62B1E